MYERGMDRRQFLTGAAAAAGAAALARARLAAQTPSPASAPADVTLRIGQVEWEIARKRTVKTTAYNGAVPGPVLRFREGRPITVEVFNDTDLPEWVHWHGFAIPAEVDGAAEEGTPAVPPHGGRRFTFIPAPSGTRYYHAHGFAGRDLNRSTYTGQFGAVIIDPASDPLPRDDEIVLALHGWDGYLTNGMGDSSLEAAYNRHSVNSHCLGFGDPLRVRQGERVLFRIVNASASLQYQLALPGHRFQVVALDGNAVAAPRAVDLLSLGPGERIDALVDMDRPGVWILGEPDPGLRKAGLGVVVEYAGAAGEPQWEPPPAGAVWDYTAFGSGPENARPAGSGPLPVPLVFKPRFAGNNWVDDWTINGKGWPKTDPVRVRAGGIYRLIFENQSPDPHPVHLHRHRFELRSVAGAATAGVHKDVVVVPAQQKVEADLVADNQGLTLFHCHNQLHMDYGFMCLFEYGV